MNVLDEITQGQIRTDLPVLASGDTVRVSAKVVEGNRERVQVFEGTVMRLRGGGITRSITVRRIASGVGVERTFKVNSPRIEKIEVVRHGVARRAQLYFLRDRVGKERFQPREPRLQTLHAFRRQVDRFVVRRRTAAPLSAGMRHLTEAVSTDRTDGHTRRIYINEK